MALCKCNKQRITDQICIIIQSQIFQHIHASSNEGSRIRNIFASYTSATTSRPLKSHTNYEIKILKKSSKNNVFFQTEQLKLSYYVFPFVELNKKYKNI